ncbi:conserved hypothetical protein, partial [Ixodes scapularis]
MRVGPGGNADTTDCMIDSELISDSSNPAVDPETFLQTFLNPEYICDGEEDARANKKHVRKKRPRSELSPSKKLQDSKMASESEESKSENAAASPVKSLQLRRSPTKISSGRNHRVAASGEGRPRERLLSCHSVDGERVVASPEKTCRASLSSDNSETATRLRRKKESPMELPPGKARTVSTSSLEQDDVSTKKKHAHTSRGRQATKRSPRALRHAGSLPQEKSPAKSGATLYVRLKDSEPQKSDSSSSDDDNGNAEVISVNTSSEDSADGANNETESFSSSQESQHGNQASSATEAAKSPGESRHREMASKRTETDDSDSSAAPVGSIQLSQVSTNDSDSSENKTADSESDEPHDRGKMLSFKDAFCGKTRSNKESLTTPGASKSGIQKETSDAQKASCSSRDKDVHARPPKNTSASAVLRTPARQRSQSPRLRPRSSRQSAIKARRKLIRTPEKEEEGLPESKSGKPRRMMTPSDDSDSDPDFGLGKKKTLIVFKPRTANFGSSCVEKSRQLTVGSGDEADTSQGSRKPSKLSLSQKQSSQACLNET